MYRAQHARVGAVLQREPRRAGPQLVLAAGRLHAVEHHAQVLLLARGFALHFQEHRRMRDRLEQDDETLGQVHRHAGLLAGAQLHVIQHHAVHHLLELRAGRQLQPRGPEHLPHVVPDRQGVGRVGGDGAHPRADGERHLHHLVQGRFVAGRAERAQVLVLVHRLQRGVGMEHPAAARAEDVPRHLEQPQPRAVQEGVQRLLRRHPVARREVQGIDAVQVRVLPLPHQLFERRHHPGVRRLPQYAEPCFRFAHRSLLAHPRRRWSASAVLFLLRQRPKDRAEQRAARSPKKKSRIYSGFFH